MGSLVSIQHWLYGGMASGLGEVAGGDLRPYSLPWLPLSCSARSMR